MSAVSIILLFALALVVAAALLSLVRLTLGPTPLDRVVALDVLAASTIVIIGVMIVGKARVDLVALMIVFVLTQFFSTVTVARFMSGGSQRGRKRAPASHTSEQRWWDRWLAGGKREGRGPQ